MKKRIFAAAVFAVAAFGAAQLLSTTEVDARVDCSTVRCAACPEGTHFAPTKTNCCRCLPN